MDMFTSCPGATEETVSSGTILQAFHFYAQVEKQRHTGPNRILPEEQDEARTQILRAVTRTLYRLSRLPEGENLLQMVELIYFCDASAPLEKGDLSLRVTKASLRLHYSERQIYYQLKRIRKVFCEVLYELERFG